MNKEQPPKAIDYKRLLIDALCSSQPAEITVCVALEKLNYMTWNGNQHDPSWKWDRTKLMSMNVQSLERLYRKDYGWLMP